MPSVPPIPMDPNGSIPSIRGIAPRHFIRDMANSILGIRSFDEKIDFMRNNKIFVDMTLLKMDFFRQN